MPSHPGTKAARISLLVVVLLAIAGVAVAGAVYLRDPATNTVLVPQSSRYTEGVVGTWQRVNPLFASGNGADEDLVSLVFSGLVRLGSNGDVEPDLAALPDITEGGRIYTFHLRDDLRWHDGEPLTSADVAFTINAVRDANFRGAASIASAWQDVTVETPDDTTVVLRLPQASSPFLARHATLPIVPEHLLGGLSAEQLREAPFNAAPVGSGPYRVVALSGSEARLDAYADYHLGRAAIGEFHIRFFTDYIAASRAVAAGEIDGLVYRSDPTADQLIELERAGDLAIETVERPAYLVLYLNNDASIFQDERVRRALSLAIDRDSVITPVHGEQALVSALPIPSSSWAYAGDYEQEGPDVETARQLLDEAGWVPHPTTGIRIRLGAELRITIRTDNDPARVAIARSIAEQLEPLGIRATVASTSFAVLRRDYLQERNYDAALAVWDQGADPDPYFGWHSSQMGSAGLNIANYSSSIADSLIREGRTVSDGAVRGDMYRQFQEIWSTSSPSVILAYQTFVFVHDEAVQPVLPSLMPTASSRFAFVSQWNRS